MDVLLQARAGPELAVTVAIQLQSGVGVQKMMQARGFSNPPLIPLPFDEEDMEEDDGDGETGIMTWEGAGGGGGG